MPTSTLSPVQPVDALSLRAPRPHRDDAGASWNGFVLMADEARRIDDNITELKVLLARIEGKLDSSKSTADDHEKRLREVEERAPAGLREQVDSLRQWRAQVIGGGLMLSILSSSLTSLLLGHVK